MGVEGSDWQMYADMMGVAARPFYFCEETGTKVSFSISMAVLASVHTLTNHSPQLYLNHLLTMEVARPIAYSNYIWSAMHRARATVNIMLLLLCRSVLTVSYHLGGGHEGG